MGTPACAQVDGSHATKQGAGWMQAHQALSRLARQHAALDAEEGRCLLAAYRAATHVHLGFASFSEYVERMFGYSPRSTQEKLRVAEALQRLPAISSALEEGALSWSAARELTRVTSPETESEWLDFARGKSVRQREEVIAGAQPGDTPSSRSPFGPRPHILRFEVAPETFALFRDACSRLQRDADARFDDDALLLAMARCVLGGPTDEGRASYQVSLTVCPECGRAAQHGGGELVRVGPEIAAMTECDGQHVGVVNTPANDLHGQPMPRCRDAHAGVDADAGAHAHVDAHGKAHADEPARASQTIPPRLRRSVLLRDHRRCRVPGCRNSRFLDVHHIQPRSQGGQNEAHNLLTLCGAHHRAIHRGDLGLELTGADIRFRHANGHQYGDVSKPPAGASSSAPLLPGTLQLYEKVHSALRHLGFRELEVRAVLDEVRRTASDSAPIDTTAEQLLREALVRLGSRR
jgi:hypothetical protein